jgi:hypothetical protein
MSLLALRGGAKVVAIANDAAFDKLVGESKGKMLVVNIVGGGADFSS